MNLFKITISFFFKIDDGTSTAQKSASDAVEKIGGLNGRLETLKRVYANNQFSINNANKEAEDARMKAEEANKVRMFKKY